MMVAGTSVTAGPLAFASTMLPETHTAMASLIHELIAAFDWYFQELGALMDPMILFAH